MDHLLYNFKLGTDIATLPSKTINEWKELGTPKPEDTFTYPKGDLQDIPYQQLDLERSWQEEVIIKFNFRNLLFKRWLYIIFKL